MSGAGLDPITRSTRPAVAPSSFAQLFGVFGGAVAWNAQIAASFAFATYPCFARHTALTAPAPATGNGTWLFAINLGAVGVAALALWVALRTLSWARAQQMHRGPQPRLVTRTFALGIAGVLASGILLLATLFALVALLGTPQCAG